MTNSVAEKPSIVQLSLKQLASMSQTDIDALDSEQIQWRRDRLEADETIVGLAGIAEMFDVTVGAVWKWRSNYLKNGGRAAQNALPKPLNDEECKQPGDTDSGSKGSPVWHAGRIREWGRQGGGLNADFVPRKGGRSKPGRPLGSVTKNRTAKS